jgi:hypothetical protein
MFTAETRRLGLVEIKARDDPRVGRDNTRNKGISSNTADSSASSDNSGGVANNDAAVRRLWLGSGELRS